jgi:hypothetical protein
MINPTKEIEKFGMGFVEGLKFPYFAIKSRSLGQADDLVFRAYQLPINNPNRKNVTPDNVSDYTGRLFGFGTSIMGVTVLSYISAILLYYELFVKH